MSVLSAIHLAIASAEKPIREISIVSAFFGFPLGGKCMNTGAVLILNYKKNLTSKLQVPDLYHLENVGALVEIDHREEQLVGVALRVPERVRHDRELVTGVSTHHTLPLSRHRCEHHDHRVAPGGCFDELPEFVAVEAQHRLFVGHVCELLHSFGQSETLE